MLFLPFKVQLSLSRLPVITISICLLCTYIFFQQTNNAERVYKSVQSFCALPHERTFYVVIDKITSDENKATCATVFMHILQRQDHGQAISEIANMAEGFSTFSEKKSHQYVEKKLQKKFAELEQVAPDNLSMSLAYYPESYSIKHMITAVFAHASWLHLIGNLIFFFAFAASIEIAMGYVKFSSLIVLIAIGTGLAYSVSVSQLENPLPTLGLSGVVMGMIGLFAYLMPKAKISCFLWILWIIRIVAVPAWMLAVWYIGWDIYNIYHDAAQSNVNYVAHVSGAVIGYLFGLAFCRERKRLIKAELEDRESARLASEMFSR